MQNKILFMNELRLVNHNFKKNDPREYSNEYIKRLVKQKFINEKNLFLNIFKRMAENIFIKEKNNIIKEIKNLSLLKLKINSQKNSEKITKPDLKIEKNENIKIAPFKNRIKYVRHQDQSQNKNINEWNHSLKNISSKLDSDDIPHIKKLLKMFGVKHLDKYHNHELKQIANKITNVKYLRNYFYQ